MLPSGLTQITARTYKRKMWREVGETNTAQAKSRESILRQLQALPSDFDEVIITKPSHEGKQLGRSFLRICQQEVNGMNPQDQHWLSSLGHRASGCLGATCVGTIFHPHSCQSQFDPQRRACTRACGCLHLSLALLLC